MKKRSLLFSAFLAISSLSFGQNQFWSLVPQHAELRSESHWSKISGLKVYQLNQQAFRNYLLQHVPAESLHAKAVPVTLPWTDGSMRTFYVTESAVMEKELADKYPEIKSYKGTDGVNYMRMSISPYSFQAYVLTSDGDVVIEAIDKKNGNQFGVFNSKDLNLDLPVSMSCGTQEFSKIESPKSSDPKHELQTRTGAGILGLPVELRTYRLALTCTGEWGSEPGRGGGSVATAIDKMVASLVYINAVYEKDIAVHMDLIGTNDRLIYLDGTIDPYPEPTSGGQTLGINTNLINAKVGAAAYDIGHVYTISCSDVGGIAFLGCVCNGNKGGGVTCWYTSDIAYVSQRITCHEMGHQYIASHTFSNCNGNESSTSYEPGSGTTIMSYSGLCGSLNVETSPLPHPNYFHSCSVEQMINNTRKFDASRCGKTTATTNTYPEPEILFPSGLYIPIRTPLKLKGRATDMENDNLTYNWEQYDAGGYGPNIGEPLTTSEGPLFKSLFPGPNSNRVLPAWNAILFNANFEKTEVLPTVSREINFRFNVRDNHPGAGGTAWKQTYFRALESAGPFAVTYPNTTQTDTLYAGICNKVNWNVANTDKSLVNCQKVNIYLMPNKANTNALIPLAMNTENDGEELVDIADTLANFNFARILVEAADNIFFDLSDTDIRIRNAPTPKVFFGVAPNALKFCVPSQTDISIRSCATKGLSGDVQLFIESGLPDNSRYNFAKSSIDVNEVSNLHLDFSDVKTSGIYRLVIAAVTPLGDTLREEIEMDLVSIDYSDLKTVYPADGLSGLNQSIQFSWVQSVNALSYTLEVASTPAFGATTIYSQSGITGSTFKPNFLFDENKLYYWRIIPTNRCGLGSPTIPTPFHTINKSCAEVEYPGNVIHVKQNRIANLVTPIREAGIISDVNIRNFKAASNQVFNVSLNLISPKGTRVKLFDKHCGNTGEFNCAFDDDGTYTLVNPSNACPPINAKLIRPVESLSKFNGEDKKGDWILEAACDDQGTSDFSSYTLDICSELIVNDPFLVINLVLQMNKGETKGIGKDLLLSQDNDNGPSELIYTVMAPTGHGDLLINGVVAVVGSKFSQKDIDDGKLSYHHTGQDQEIDGFLFTVEDGHGGWFGSDFFKIVIGTVGTSDQEDNLDLNIYPNPTTGMLQISADKALDKNASLRILNLQGQLMLRKDIGFQKADVVNIQHLQAGIYILEIRSGNKHSVNKIVLEK